MFLWFMPGLERRIGSAKFFFRYIFLGKFILITGILFQLIFIGSAYALRRFQWFYYSGFFYAYFIEFFSFCYRNPYSRIR